MPYIWKPLLVSFVVWEVGLVLRHKNLKRNPVKRFIFSHQTYDFRPKCILNGQTIYYIDVSLFWFVRHNNNQKFVKKYSGRWLESKEVFKWKLYRATFTDSPERGRGRGEQRARPPPAGAASPSPTCNITDKW